MKGIFMATFVIVLSGHIMGVQALHPRDRDRDGDADSNAFTFITTGAGGTAGTLIQGPTYLGWPIMAWVQQPGRAFRLMVFCLLVERGCAAQRTPALEHLPSSLQWSIGRWV